MSNQNLCPPLFDRAVTAPKLLGTAGPTLPGPCVVQPFLLLLVHLGLNPGCSCRLHGRCMATELPSNYLLHPPKIIFTFLVNVRYGIDCPDLTSFD